MDAAQALAELTELSSQVLRAVVLDEGGAVLAATDEDPVRAEALAGAARAVVAAANELHSGAADVSRVEVELAEGGLFVLREGGRTIAATTGAGPTAGLVAYDLRTCLQGIDAKPKRRRAARKPKQEAAGEGVEDAE
jgi:predicted regulator of Ras-like GTPase activity (Roadblock/LC7/MglB family)